MLTGPLRLRKVYVTTRTRRLTLLWVDVTFRWKSKGSKRGWNKKQQKKQQKKNKKKTQCCILLVWEKKCKLEGWEDAPPGFKLAIQVLESGQLASKTWWGAHSWHWYIKITRGRTQDPEWSRHIDASFNHRSIFFLPCKIIIIWNSFKPCGTHRASTEPFAFGPEGGAKLIAASSLQLTEWHVKFERRNFRLTCQGLPLECGNSNKVLFPVEFSCKDLVTRPMLTVPSLTWRNQ